MLRGTPEHAKTAALAAKLGITIYGAVGLLEMMWHFTSRSARQGDIGRWPDTVIAAACHWDREPSVLVEALAEVGWLDESDEHRLIVHDWHEHADRTTKRALERSGQEVPEHRDAEPEARQAQPADDLHPLRGGDGAPEDRPRRGPAPGAHRRAADGQPEPARARGRLRGHPGGRGEPPRALRILPDRRRVVFPFEGAARLHRGGRLDLQAQRKEQLASGVSWPPADGHETDTGRLSCTRARASTRA